MEPMGTLSGRAFLSHQLLPFTSPSDHVVGSQTTAAWHFPLKTPLELLLKGHWVGEKILPAVTETGLNYKGDSGLRYLENQE